MSEQGELTVRGEPTRTVRHLRNGMRVLVEVPVDHFGNAKLSWTDGNGQHVVEVPALFIKLLTAAEDRLVETDRAILGEAPKKRAGRSVWKFEYVGDGKSPLKKQGQQRLYTRVGDIKTSMAWALRRIPPDLRAKVYVVEYDLVESARYAAPAFATPSAKAEWANYDEGDS